MTSAFRYAGRHSATSVPPIAPVSPKCSSERGSSLLPGSGAHEPSLACETGLGWLDFETFVLLLREGTPMNLNRRDFIKLTGAESGSVMCWRLGIRHGR